MNGKDKDIRAQEFALIGLKLAEQSSYIQVKREMIARAAGTTASSVNYVIGGHADVRDAIIAKAVELENVTVVAQALALRHPIVMAAPQLLKARAVQLLGTY